MSCQNNRIIVGEKTEQNAPMTNQQKVDVAFSEDGTGQRTISSWTVTGIQVLP